MSTDEIRDALERIVAGRYADRTEAVRAALVNEKVDALAEPGAGEAVIVRAGAAGAAVAVVAAGTRRAWLLGTGPGPGGGDGDDAVFDALIDALGRHGGADSLRTGGPPGSYLCSGVDEADAPRWTGRGFVERSRHVDLRAWPRAGARRDPRVRRVGHEEHDAIGAWVARTFGAAWSREAARALRLGELFVAEGGDDDDGDGPYAGFAAHSGNNAALGTFGPVGVAPGARGAGLGSALALAALDGLAARGFGEVTIPWVDPARVGFYRALTARLEVQPRVLLARSLRGR